MFAHRTRSIAIAIIASTAMAASASAAKIDNDECIRTNQARAFAVESENSVIIRQGRENFRRVTVAENCPLNDADRVAFFIGNNVASATIGGRTVPVNKSTISERICTKTPHARLAVIEDGVDQSVTRCAITSIAPANRTDFESIEQKHDIR